jgi:hypothetical protein
MTHDELLIEINRRLDVALYNGDAQSIHALRAVVELHTPSPIPDWVPSKEELMCWCAHVYPCPTIQVIEKELQ